uniref:Anaphase-promoting complex subunit 4 WD40 domain-containing protein n=1 Tax=viral metagenome TaxID=1070528 RepID=A0A6C0EJH3_9ZZZZ
MNFIENDENGLLHANFNQNKDCIIFGTTIGFYVYTCNPFKKIISRRIIGGVSIIEMLNKSNIMIFTGNVDKGLYPNNKLIIWDDNKGEVIGEIEFKTKILNIKITKEIIVVITNYKIYIYSFNNLQLIKSIEISEEVNGLCEILNNNIIAYPGKEIGSMCINYFDQENDLGSGLDTNIDTEPDTKQDTKQDTEQDTKQDTNRGINKSEKIIKAHLNQIERFCLSKDGSYIATCSHKGTLLRIFNIEDNVLVKELRRGSDQATIVDLKFNDDLTLLLCSSDKGTIHIFNALVDDAENKNTNFYALSGIKNYLPSYFSSEWSYKQFYLPGVITFSTFITDEKIISIGSNGCLYNLEFNKDKNEIESTIKFISNEDDPFNNRKSTIK